ncbi:MAG TPA: S8 family serine peptidase [Acidimicrobiia bacterium]|nr:S8 family serine peptidase [Acidimicrobiia bacterium]
MKRKLLVVVAALATAVATAIPVGAGPTLMTAATDNSRSPYIVVMESSPVLGITEVSSEESEPPDPDSAEAESYVEELQEEKTDALEEAGVDASAMVASYDYAANGFSALLTEAEAEALSLQKGVASVIRDELRQLHTDNSPSFLGLDDRGGAWASGYTGKGVVVGVIDSGIWPEHPSFADNGNLGPSPITFQTIDLDPDPATEFISTGCDFGNTAYEPTDAPFTCNNKLIGARNMRSLYDTLIPGELYHSARDYDGHGTHTASTAAGNAGVEASIFGREFGEISGIAPDAWVVMYSACGDLGCFGGDLADAIDQAVADGVHVINYSIGSDTPGLDSIDDIAFLFAANRGVFVSVSNGNAGPGASTVGSPASVPWVTSVGASLQNRAWVAEVRIDNGSRSRWSFFSKKQSGIFEGASVTPGTDGKHPFVDSADHGNEACDPEVDFNPDITGMVVLCPRSPGRIAKSLAVYEQGGVGMVMYNANDNQSLLTDNHWVPTVLVNNSDGLALKAYIDEKGAEARVELTSAERERQRGSIMADFSARGPVGSPASQDIIKPDVTAPGVQILAGNSLTPSAGPAGEPFQAISGTSMSSPHVAGLLALIKQAHPDWTPAMAKSALMTTARQDVRKEDGRTRADPFDFGAGHVDPSGRAGADGSLFNPGLVYRTRTIDYVGFLCDTSASYLVAPLVGEDCDFLANAGFQTQAENLNYPSIGVGEVPGSKTVIRTVTNVSDETASYRADVDEPRGFDVDVSPSRLRLAPGASASFEVTIVNEDAPIGEWRFGSLTWESGRTEVRSPIAVKAAAIEVPRSVTGTGETGSASFEVAFGYNGPYVPAAHGMAADAPAGGTVGFDEDQTFDPTDVTANGATAHTFTLSGSAFLRIAMDVTDTTGNPDNDIDLYLYRGTELVAVSVAGGIDELIELEAPADGSYTLYVHGWQVAEADPGVGYTFHFWDVRNAATSLSINPATPTTATLGTVGTVVVDWTGLAPSGSYLGAVSHSDGTDTFGLTLVEVDS